jgi:dihydropyrimidinase
MDLVITGGEVITAGSRGIADIGVSGGRIVQIGGDVPTDASTRVIDATGRFVIPGGVDMHVHLSPAYIPAGVGPGGVTPTGDQALVDDVLAWADDFVSGSHAAAAGGITTIGNMTFSRSGEAPVEAIERTARDAGADSIVDFVLHPVLLTAQGMAEQVEQLAAAGCSSVKFFMMFDSFDAQAGDYVKVLARAGEQGLVTMIHCEDACVVGHVTGQLVAAGHTHPSNYGRSRPAYAEAMAVARAVAYAEATGSPIYIVHLSSREALEIARQARARGVPVFVETRPIYLLFDETYLDGEDGGLYVGNPPLRSAEDVSALWSGLSGGGIDTVCTDHAPSLKADKIGPDVDITTVAPGMADLETMLPLLYTEGVRKGRITMEQFVEVTSTNAARIFGIYPQKGTVAVGSDADLVIWDPAEPTSFDGSSTHSRTDFSLYDGWEIEGGPVTTISRGVVVYDAGEIVAGEFRGRLVRKATGAATGDNQTIHIGGDNDEQ